MKTQTRYHIEYIDRPGLTYKDAELTNLVAALRDTAATCFETLPDYQVMRGTREELSDKIIAVAWADDKRIAGFCSAVLLPVDQIGDVLHLGLTCVRPENRGEKLTHLLTSKVVIGYLLRHRPIGKVWVSNCACVLSSLGNVAIHFDNVYPSPLSSKAPSKTHRTIARAIDTHYRDKMYVLPDAVLDEETFVFRGSVNQTIFHKDEEDRRFHHRIRDINLYYQELLNFDQGDEALQVGSVSLLTGIKYHLRKKKLRMSLGGSTPQPEYT